MKITLSAVKPLSATPEDYAKFKKLSSYFLSSINGAKQVNEAKQYGLNYYMKSPKQVIISFDSNSAQARLNDGNCAKFGWKDLADVLGTLERIGVPQIKRPVYRKSSPPLYD